MRTVLYISSFVIVLSFAMAGESANEHFKLMKKLKSKLFSQTHDKDILPCSSCILPEKFQLRVECFFVALGDIYETEEKLSTVFGFLYEWVDEFMQWDPEDFGNITDIVVDAASVWSPKLTVYNRHYSNYASAQQNSQNKITFDHEGNAMLIDIQAIDTTCELDITNFPFDTQTCIIDMFDASYPKYINITSIYNHSLYTPDGAWDLVSATTEPWTDDEFEIYLTFKRKPLFSVVTVILPLLLLALLTPSAFLIPPDSGERLGFSITMLLATSVYMTLLSDNMPKISSPMANLTFLLFFFYVLNSVIVFIVIINMRIYTISDKVQIGCCLRKLVRILAVFSCSNNRTIASANHVKDSNQNPNNKEDSNTENISIAQHNSGKISWKEVSKALDLLCALVIYISETVLIIVYLAIVISYKK